MDSRLAPVPAPQWEYLHNHTLLILRVYYHGDTLDPSLTDPIISPFTMTVPNERPPAEEQPVYKTFEDGNSQHDAASTDANNEIGPNTFLVAALARIAAGTNPMAPATSNNNNPPTPAIYPQAADAWGSHVMGLANNNNDLPAPAMYPQTVDAWRQYLMTVVNTNNNNNIPPAQAIYPQAGAMMAPVASAFSASAASASTLTTTVAALSSILSNSSNNRLTAANATAAGELVVVLQSVLLAAPPSREPAHAPAGALLTGASDPLALRRQRELASILLALQHQISVGATTEEDTGTYDNEDQHEQGAATEPPRKKPAR